MPRPSPLLQQLRTFATSLRPIPSKRLHHVLPRPAALSEMGLRFGGTRGISSTPPRYHGDLVRPEPGTGIKLIFRDSNGADIKTVEGNEGDDILSLAHEYDVDLEGACEGSVACSTCHVVIDPASFDILPEADDEENDMLDLAFGLEDTS
ncbi:hypothetical protein B9479_006097 [Cryptococcus floricola]|uniref:2Fe-2S ferredoxin-type domain-containing protein n=1 Tax=Cryptococcus floricola TaxID=2591691 RepID=A0A5D3ASZ4_9TREE|nr:hypothetical protein B9479_006097 [Cryptococcus floricola]